MNLCLICNRSFEGASCPFCGEATFMKAGPATYAREYLGTWAEPPPAPAPVSAPAPLAEPVVEVRPSKRRK